MASVKKSSNEKALLHLKNLEDKHLKVTAGHLKAALLSRYVRTVSLKEKQRHL